MKKSKKSTSSSLELIGGVFLVEKFKDGTERREELDGEVILKLVLSVLKEAIKKVK